MLTVALLASALTGCVTPGGPWPPVSRPDDAVTTGTIEEPGEIKYVASDEQVRLGTEYFNRGDYGNAERQFRDAVEKAPKDVTAWIGLAASYDRIGRFDLADRAYDQAIKLGGATTLILNNQGYSYMLRGDIGKAEEKLMEAYRRDPGNPTILNNINLLNAAMRQRRLR